MRSLAVPGTVWSAPDAVADAEALAAAAGEPDDGVLLAGSPPELACHIPAAGAAVARVACATDSVPAAWVRALEGTDAVWVPGEFSRAALQRSGVSAERLHVVAPLIDVEHFSPAGPAQRPADARSFVFLAPLDWTRASGWDVLVRAWAQEFAPDEDVTLVIRAWSSLGYTAPLVADALHGELEALGHDPAQIADLIVDVSADHAAPSPDALRGADCVVAPARGDAWGRTLLAALACGAPLIASDWGLGADLLAAGAAFASVPAAPSEIAPVAAREVPALTGLRWGEPDVGALRALMRQAVTDRDGAAERGARGRDHVVAHHAVRRPLATPRGRAARRALPAGGGGARPQDVSFVLQGPVERGGRGSTAQACAAIRAHYPGAEIVVSTWEGTDTAGLDCDRVVLSPDPGVVGTCTYNVNTNRQIVSSLAGVRATTRPLVAKLRSDILVVSDALLSHWGRWQERTDELRLFEQRVLVPNVFARRPSHLSPYPLHLSDWAFFGTRADIERLFDVPLMTVRQSTTTGGDTRLTRLYHLVEPRPSYSPEQWIWTQALRAVSPRLRLRHVFDLTPESLHLTELSFANNVAILDTYTQYGIWCPKYAGPNRVFEDVTLFQHEEWLELYETHCLGRTLDASSVSELLERLGRGDFEATREDARRLRRAGFSWEAQLLECVLLGPRVRRDSTTGGVHRWHLDQAVVGLAREQLAARAAETGAARHASATRPRPARRQRSARSRAARRA